MAGVEGKWQALLTVTDTAGATRGLVLDAERGGYEFEQGADATPRRVADIRAPTGFRWAGADGEIRPEYAPPAP